MSIISSLLVDLVIPHSSFLIPHSSFLTARRLVMGHLVKTVVIRAPVAQVWEFITHTSRLTEWAAEEVRDATADAMTVGTSWVEKLHIAGAPLETTWRIQEMQPPQRMEFTGVSTGGGKARGV